MYIKVCIEKDCDTKFESYYPSRKRCDDHLDTRHPFLGLRNTSKEVVNKRDSVVK